MRSPILRSQCTLMRAACDPTALRSAPSASWSPEMSSQMRRVLKGTLARSSRQQGACCSALFRLGIFSRSCMNSWSDQLGTLRWRTFSSVESMNFSHGGVPLNKARNFCPMSRSKLRIDATTRQRPPSLSVLSIRLWKASSPPPPRVASSASTINQAGPGHHPTPPRHRAIGVRCQVLWRCPPDPWRKSHRPPMPARPRHPP